MDKSLFIAVVCVLTILVPMVSPVYAEDDAEQEMLVFDLGKIEVVGEIEKIEPAATAEIEREQFDAQLKESVVDAVDQTPGVYVTVGDKNEPQFMIRGLSQTRVLVLYDGVPMSAPYYGDLDTSELPLDNLSQMKVVRGNASVLYGPNALGGVVSLVSSKPGPKPNFNLLATIDQEANLMGRFTHGARKDALYYQISAGFRDSDGWPMSDDFKTTYDEDGNVLEDGDVRENADFSQWSAGLKVGGEWADSELSFSANYVDAEKSIPPTTDTFNKVRYWNFPEWKKYTLTLAGRKQFNEAVEFRANAFYHKYDNVLRNFRDADYSQLSWESTYDDYSTGLLARMSWNVNDAFAFRTSLNGLMDDHKAQGDVGDPWEEYQAATYSLAAEGEWKPQDMFTVQLGASYEMYDFDSIDNVEGSSASFSNRTDDINAFTYSVLSSLRFAEAHELTGGISFKTRFPTMHQLFANIEEFEPQDVGTLDPEEAMQYTVGYTYHPEPAWSLGASAYYYDVTDLN